MKLRVVLGLSAAIALAGCDLAPLYQTPSVTLPAHFSDTTGGGVGPPPTGAWWRIFKDPRLNALEDELEAANPDLAAAYAAYRRAQEHARAAVSGLFPEVDFNGQLSANKQSANRPLRSASQPTYYGANEAYAGVASYEIDIWGRVADLVKAAQYNAQAAGDAATWARLGLQAELARDYVDLRGLDGEAKVLADTIKLYQSAYDLTKQRLDAKIAPPVDAQRAEAQLENVKAQASDLAVRRTALVDAIATLAGRAAAGYGVPPNPAPITLPHSPRAVPGDVLRRRPDVAEAERAFSAAIALVGSARANLYPKFTIALLGGTQDTSLRLLDPINTFYTFGPSLSVPLFDFGLREAELKEAQAQAKIAAEQYRSTVLRAVREVQDNTSALRWLALEQTQSSAASTAAGNALKMSLALYRDGAASYLDVVTAQDEALLTQRSSIGVSIQAMDAYVGLLLALGGGWTVSPADETNALPAVPPWP